jgi:hypothetical protein
MLVLIICFQVKVTLKETPQDFETFLMNVLFNITMLRVSQLR